MSDTPLPPDSNEPTGDDVPARREFITANARDVRNLDF